MKVADHSLSITVICAVRVPRALGGDEFNRRVALPGAVASLVLALAVNVDSAPTETTVGALQDGEVTHG